MSFLKKNFKIHAFFEKLLKKYVFKNLPPKEQTEIILRQKANVLHSPETIKEFKKLFRKNLKFILPEIPEQFSEKYFLLICAAMEILKGKSSGEEFRNEVCDFFETLKKFRDQLSTVKIF